MKRPGKMASEVLRSLGQKAATSQYPFVKSGIAPNFRGRLKFAKELCIGCKLCMRDCPADAITITKIGEKQFECTVDLSKCIYCAQCVDSCPRKALKSTEEFELAELNRQKLKVVLNVAGEPEATPQK